MQRGPRSVVAKWQAATSGGPTMFARIGIM
jgi:hypothetical protein